MLIDVLDAGAADVVVRQVTGVLQLLELVLGDRPGVADQRRIQLAGGVEAQALGIDAHTREELRPLGDRDRDLARQRRGRDPHGLVRVANALVPDHFRDVVARDVQQSAQTLRELLLADPWQVDRDDAQRESSDVPGKDVPVSIDDPTAFGGDR